MRTVSTFAHARARAQTSKSDDGHACREHRCPKAMTVWRCPKAMTVWRRASATTGPRLGECDFRLTRRQASRKSHGVKQTRRPQVQCAHIQLAPLTQNVRTSIRNRNEVCEYPALTVDRSPQPRRRVTNTTDPQSSARKTLNQNP